MGFNQDFERKYALSPQQQRCCVLVLNLKHKELLKCLVLLKSVFFSPDWHSSIYKESCHQLNEERVSALLRMLQPQLSVDERMEGAGF